MALFYFTFMDKKGGLKGLLAVLIHLKVLSFFSYKKCGLSNEFYKGTKMLFVRSAAFKRQ